MTTARLILLLLPFISGILPVAEQNRPSTSRLSRGPREPSLAELASTPSAHEAAEQALGSRRRIAVVRLQTAAEELPSWAAPAALDVELAQSLRYSPQWIVDSPLTVRRLVRNVPAEVTAAAAADMAQRLSADELTFVGIASEGTDGEIQIVAERWTVSPDGTWSRIEKRLRRPVTEATRRTAVGEIASQWVPALAPEVRQELARPGTEETAAYTAWAGAIDNTLEALTSPAAEQARQLAERGLQQSREAISVDPGFVAPALAAAACLEILGRDAEQADLLARTYAVRNSRLTDSLTMQEFEADYERLVERNTDAAFDGYAQVLETDPVYLPALWSLLEILTGEGVVAPSSEDEALLGELAARVLLGHPHSHIAGAIAKADDGDAAAP